MSGTTVSVLTPAGEADAYLARPDDSPDPVSEYPGVLLLTDAFGLRPRTMEMADRIAAAGYVVLVPNIFYRNGTAPVFDLVDLMKPENRSTMLATIAPVAQKLTPEVALADVASYLDSLQALPGVRPGPLGMTGYCMGGTLALRSAGTFGARIGAVASFHGGNLATEDQSSPHLLVGGISGAVYVAHADNDGSAPPEQQERLESTLAAAGVEHITELYAGARHGFTMSDTASHSVEAENRHWTALLGLFERHLGGRPPIGGDVINPTMG